MPDYSKKTSNEASGVIKCLEGKKGLTLVRQAYQQCKQGQRNVEGERRILKMTQYLDVLQLPPLGIDTIRHKALIDRWLTRHQTSPTISVFRERVDNVLQNELVMKKDSDWKVPRLIAADLKRTRHITSRQNPAWVEVDPADFLNFS